MIRVCMHLHPRVDVDIDVDIDVDTFYSAPNRTERAIEDVEKTRESP